MSERESRLRSLFPALKKRLLSLGGTDIQPEPTLMLNLEPEAIEALLDHGKAASGANAKVRKGNMRARDCHENSRWLSNHFKSYEWRTGFALSKDGMWRVHSWCVDSAGGVVETTEPRSMYWGIPAREDPAFEEYF